MNTDQSQTLSQVIREMTGEVITEKKGGKFFFRLYLNSVMRETPIEALDLGVRAYNSLKRAGYSTVGDLAEAIAGGVQISRIRNCGTKSCREIMEKLFLYQYSSLPKDKRAGYMEEVIRLNLNKRA